MYRCGNEAVIGDCVYVNVSVMVTEMNVPDGSVGIVLDKINNWHKQSSGVLVTLAFGDDSIQDIPASWCTLCQRK